MDNKIITKWLDNPQSELTLNELYYILDFIQNPDNKFTIETHFRKTYDNADNSTSELDNEKIDHIYNLIQSQIQEQQNNKKIKRFSFSKIPNFFYKVSAVLIFPLIALAIYNYVDNGNLAEDSSMQIIQSDSANLLSKIDYFSPPGARTRIYLPDSSEVWLNGKSKLTVPNNFGAGKRDVILYGEAFFSVTKDASKPFNVHTPDAILEVLGTTFNVSAYEDSPSIETTLVSGEVNLIYNKSDKTNSVKIMPSQKVTLSKVEKDITTEIVDTEVYQSWKDGKIILRNHSLKQVIPILEKWFNVAISCDKNLEGYKFTATLDNKSLDQILMFISYSSPINYEFNGNNVHLTARK